VVIVDVAEVVAEEDSVVVAVDVGDVEIVVGVVVAVDEREVVAVELSDVVAVELSDVVAELVAVEVCVVSSHGNSPSP